MNRYCSSSTSIYARHSGMLVLFLIAISSIPCRVSFFPKLQVVQPPRSFAVRRYLLDPSSKSSNNNDNINEKVLGDVPKQTKQTSLGKLNTDATLNTLLESMPLQEKYALLLQSYATNIMDNTNRTVEAMTTMETLFMEMLSKSILPTDKSSKQLIDAASTFCNSIKLGKSLQLSKAGGNLRAFGAANSQLTVPITSASAWKALMGDAAVPFDDREAETLFAVLTVGTGFLWIGLQIFAVFFQDLQLYSTLLGLSAIGAVGLDVWLRQGKGLKLASAGLERLVLRDSERETHSDGAAFLVGYLLGLPCFCFRPDVTEALKMLRDSPESLEVYRQPKAAGLSSSGTKKPSSSSSSSFGLFGMGGGASSTSTKSSSSSDTGLSTMFVLPDIPKSSGQGSASTSAASSANQKDDMLGLGRVLIWLMAPVAAEYLKYGKTVVSDPRRSVKLLKVLESVQSRESSSSSTTASTTSTSPKDTPITAASGMSSYAIPSDAADQDALLQWAYYEANALIKQYGDLLEGVNGYLGTGTSTVGECVMLVEDELN